MEKRIVVSLQIEGAHRWPDCPIEEVSYLRHLHRHIFYINAVKAVEHNDRQIEIIQFKHQIEQYLGTNYWDDNLRLMHFGSMSCEDIAEEIGEKFGCTQVSVLEDNENGAIWMR